VSDYEIRVDGAAAAPGVPAGEWRLTWTDPERGIAHLSDGTTSLTAVVEGAGSEWFVTFRGRRISVTVRTHREQMLAEAAVAARGHGGPTDVKATLPGLVVAIEIEEGSEVEEGQPLLTIEAMKMQNEVRAPRAGRVETLAVEGGQAVATGQLLLRLA